jgi:phosphoribosyl 1,2-cyclic phosphodiesterase
MEIVFLGTGGGRFNLIEQYRRTGGFRINGPIIFHVDPGPGALISSKLFGQDPSNVDVIISTHNHIDHVNDIGLLVEAMVLRSRAKKGEIIGSKEVIDGDCKGDKGITNYHLQKLKLSHIAIPGKPINLKKGGARATVLPTKTRHDDETGVGFVLGMGGARIGYTSDTEYFDGIAEQYLGCDVLILNLLKKAHDGIPGHMATDDAEKILRIAKPKLAIITHMGLSLLKSGPESEAKKLGAQSGVTTVAATDGLKISIPPRSLFRAEPEYK